MINFELFANWSHAARSMWLFLALLMLAGGCAKPLPPLAVTWLDSTRMQVMLIDPDKPAVLDPEAKDGPRIVTAFSFEPVWNALRTQLAFTRIDVTNKSARVLSVFDPESGKYRDIAAMSVPNWNNYGFAPVWNPSGTALAFKLRTEEESGVFVALMEEQRVVQLLPDPASQIGELVWGVSNFCFTVNVREENRKNQVIRCIVPPSLDRIGPGDPLRLAGSAESFGEGLSPQFYHDTLYYSRPAEQGVAFEILRHDFKKKTDEIIQSGAGPFFNISSNGMLAYQTDPEGRGRPIRLTLRRLGKDDAEITNISAYRFLFSKDGKHLVGIRLNNSEPRYFIYDCEKKVARDLISLRSDIKAEALAELLDRPLFDW